MRLLQYSPQEELIFRPPSNEPLPEYAILSHTWLEDNDQEVTFADIQNGSNKHKDGWRKLHFCGQQARRYGLQYFWVDTCCIDKSGTSEVSEAITSMYRWYSNAERCFVLLDDVQSRKRDRQGNLLPVSAADIRSSKWFTRGWTLQELLAPSTLEFYTRDAQALGTKFELIDTISQITGISQEALRCVEPAKFLPDDILSWVKNRNTKKPEDKAYCLVGVLNVSMSPHYGEGGEHAMNRLYKAIGESTTYRLSSYRCTVNTAQQTIPANPQPSHLATSGGTASTVTIEALLESLRFTEMSDRKANIEKAVPKTCHWLVKHPLWNEWIGASTANKQGGFLWIKGNAGVGKSTLIKFADDHVRQKRLLAADGIHISFYFNARGSILQKSTIGMYRALIVHILEAVPENQVFLDDPLFRDHLTALGDWTAPRLESLFTLLVARLGRRSLHCFIDALDECDEQEVKRMIDIFSDVSYEAAEEGHPVHICLASRHYPTIVPPEDGRELIVEYEGGHRADLVEFVNRRLRIGSGTRVAAIKEKLIDKANRIFMWLVLVVPMLNDTYQRAKMADVEAQLERTPPQLSRLFNDILLRDQAHKEELLCCLQWVLFAKRPLSPTEFFIALECADPASTIATSPWDPDRATHEDLSRRVRDCSKGLAEVTKSKKAPVVQFIHESVRDYLLKENGLLDVWPALKPGLSALSHDMIKSCCLRYLEADLTGLLECASKDKLSATYPFLDYAVTFIFQHADEAASFVAQDEMLRHFPLQRWCEISNVWNPYKTRRYSPTASWIYVLASGGHARLINVAQQLGFPAWQSGEHFVLPFFVALRNKRLSAVRALLTTPDLADFENILAELPTGNQLELRKGDRDLLSWTIRNGCTTLMHHLITHPGFCFYEAISSVEHAYYAAVTCGFEDIARVWLRAALEDHETHRFIFQTQAYRELGKRWLAHQAVLTDAQWALAALNTFGNSEHISIFDPVLQDDRQVEVLVKRALKHAATFNQVTMLELMLKRGLDANCILDKHGRNPLGLAAELGRYDHVRVLLQYGVEVDPCNVEGATPLLLASRHHHVQVMQELIEHTGNIHARDVRGRGAIHQACDIAGIRSINVLTAVDVLIDGGCDPNAQDHDGNTALMLLASAGHHPIFQDDSYKIDLLIKDLLDAGADRRLVDACGQTAFLRACTNRQDRPQIIRNLHHEGAASARDNEGRTALMLIMGDYKASRSETVSWLIDAGADANAKDQSGRTAIMFAAHYGCGDAIEVLLEQGADVNARNQSGFTVIMFAFHRGHASVVEALVRHGAEYDYDWLDGRLKESYRWHVYDELKSLRIYFAKQSRRTSNMIEGFAETYHSIRGSGRMVI